MIGRADELQALRQRVLARGCVTVLGPGGVGKTRLVMELAQRGAPAAGDRIWCELAALERPEQVLPALAAACGLSVAGSERPLLPRLVAALDGRRVLLVMDNAEHVLAVVADLVQELVRQLSGLAVVVTSTRPLGIPGEQQVRLAALAVPPAELLDAARLAGFGAVQLLWARLQACDAQVALQDPDALREAAALCRRLDGHPLAIELAALRVAALGWAAMRTGLATHFALLDGARRDGQARHESLQVLLDWSHALLPPALQAAWQALSVFRSGWTIAAAQALLRPDLGSHAAVLAALAELEQRSMIVREAASPVPRLRMLEPHRADAAARLQASGRADEIAHRHAEHIAVLMESAHEAVDTTPGVEHAHAVWFGELQSALHWALDRGQRRLASQLLSRSAWLWRAQGQLEALRAALSHPLMQTDDGAADDRGLALARALSLLGEGCSAVHLRAAARQAQADAEGRLPVVARAQAALCEASAHARLGDATAQRACLDRAESLLQGWRHGKTYAWLCDARAWALQMHGDLPGALSWAQAARAVWQRTGASHDESRAALHVADLLLALDDVEAALHEGQSLVERLRGTLHREDLGRALANLGAAYWRAGHVAAARDALVQAVHLLSGLEFSFWVYDHLALLALADGRPAMAARMLGHADAGYARQRHGRRLANEARAHAAALQALQAAVPAEVLARCTAEGGLADERQALAWVEALQSAPVAIQA